MTHLIFRVYPMYLATSVGDVGDAGTDVSAPPDGGAPLAPPVTSVGFTREGMKRLATVSAGYSP